MRCGDCAHWVNRRTTVYGDASRIDTFQTANGKGLCEVLNLETVAAFGCVEFVEGHDHTVISVKDGEPWQHWKYGPCPDCSGNAAKPAGGMCIRCAGIGKVRYYDDGFVGDEQTQMHPKEKASRAPPTCPKCSEQIELSWKACPHCGVRLEPPVKAEVIPFELSVVA